MTRITVLYMKTDIQFWSRPFQFLEWETFRTKFGENQITHFMLKNLFFENLTVHEIKLKHIVELERPQMAIWHVRIACWITKPTDTHTQYKKDKAVPLQAWSGPEGSRKLRFPDFMTTAQDGGKVVSFTHRPPFSPRKYTWYSFLLEAESNQGP